MLSGSCHCGAVRYHLASVPERVTDCNCSVCRRIAALWAYYRPQEVILDADEGATAAYVQGDRTLALHHCRTCGCTTHWTSLLPDLDRMGVNVRLLDPKHLAGVPIRRLDGADTWEELP